MPERVVALAQQVGEQSSARLGDLDRMARSTRILALNALVEAARAKEAGPAFAVIAREVGAVAQQAAELSSALSSELAPAVAELTALGHRLVEEVRGRRLADLALTAVELADRNLYERTCDVRWWATDADIVRAADAGAGTGEAARASERLAVILRSYTVYLDLWVADRNGRVIANAAPGAYPRVVGSDVSGERWFQDALATGDGDEYAVEDVRRSDALDAPVAGYGAAVRRDGELHGEVLGALGVFFDWGPQADAILAGLRLSAEDEQRTRKLLLSSSGLVLAASDGRGVLTERVALRTGDDPVGTYVADGSTVGYALTPGYETYRGLGWYGALVQR